MIIAAYILIATAVLIFVFRPLFAGREKIGQASKKEGRRRKLLEDRETLYESIRELDFDYRMGKVEEDDYRQTRTRYETQAVNLMKAIDQTNGRAEAVEDRVEQEIATLRRSRKGKRRKKPAERPCPKCKTVSSTGARFCPQCGTPLNSK